jgi:hypothetical protein
MLNIARRLGALLLISSFALPALGQQKDAAKEGAKDAPKAPAGEVTLAWEFQKDKPFYQEMTSDSKQTLKLMGQEITQTQKHIFVFSWTPKEQDKDKNWIVTQKIEGIRVDIEIAGNKVQFDSSNQATAQNNQLADLFKALVGSEFKLTITPDLKITKIEGREEFINKLSKANPPMETILKQILGDEALKQMAEPSFAGVPPTPVKQGATWQKKIPMNMGPIGTYDTTYKFTYEGKEGKLDKVKVEEGLTYAPPGPNVSGTLPFKITKGTLTTKGATGKFLFDSEKKRMDSSELKLTLEGNLTIDIGGLTTDVALQQEQTTTVKTYDSNPMKK